MPSTASGQIRIPESNLVDLGILIGLLITDGCVTWSGGSWRITFTGKSKELHKIFKEKVNKLFGINKFTEIIDKLGVLSTSFRNKKIAEFLHKEIPTFRTKPFGNGELPPTRLPTFFKELSSKELAEILKVMFSADGSAVLGVKWHKTKARWVFTRRISFASVHPTIREQVAELLREKFGMNPKIWKKEIVLDEKNDIFRFQKEIGFVDGVKISRKSKNWIGFEKNKILELIVKTFQLRKKDLEKFSNKEEIINFLKTLL